MNGMKKISADELPWFWAMQNQIYLFDKHDANWIEAAGRGWSQVNGQDDLYTFLKAYGLIRGPLASLFGNKFNSKRNVFLKICHENFSPPLDVKNAVKDLSGRWAAALQEVNKCFGVGAVSATSKMLWFYHPEYMVMFDHNNKIGLSKWLVENGCIGHNKDLDHTNFLSMFSFYFDQIANKNIEVVRYYFNRKYPYSRRVAEKRLWLAGSGTETETLASLKAGLELLPVDIGKS